MYVDGLYMQIQSEHHKGKTDLCRFQDNQDSEQRNSVHYHNNIFFWLNHNEEDSWHRCRLLCHQYLLNQDQKDRQGKCRLSLCRIRYCIHLTAPDSHLQAHFLQYREDKHPEPIY